MQKNTRIKTNRLTLRPLTIDDCDDVCKYVCDDDNCRFMIFFPCENAEEAFNYLVTSQSNWCNEKPAFYDFAVVLSDVVIGHVSIYFINEDDNSSVELGWVFNRQYQGRGYATEAVNALLDFAANRLGYSKIIACCDYRNVASYKLMERVGMTLIDDKNMRLNKGENIKTKELKYLLDINTNNIT